MFDFLAAFVSPDGLTPRSACLLGRNDVIMTEVIADFVIAFCCVSTPLALVYYARQREDFWFHRIFVLFSAFVVSCGTTHIIGALTFWYPIYQAEAAIMVLTAVLALITFAALVPLMPAAFSIPKRAVFDAAHHALLAETEEHKDALHHHAGVSIDLDALVAERTRVLEDARIAAEASNHAKSEFIAAMSHELRTPLNIILGFSEIMRDDTRAGLINSKFLEYAADIHECGTYLLELINEILDLAKLDSGNLEIDKTTIDLDYIMNNIMRHLAVRIVKAGHTLTYHADPNCRYLQADERAIKQILINLLADSIKYTHHGGLIQITAQAINDHELCIAVTDNGVGIAGDKIEHLGKPFQSFDNRYARSTQSTGLGLALVKGLVALHDGRLTIESIVGQGTKVSVHLPRGESRLTS